ncbi:ABC transporter permease [SAR86 cluster bacterium]|jgi:oligopeptide transport system permease protein|nr:ABC transporter permease [SAR86 cluster bacterium]
MIFLFNFYKFHKLAFFSSIFILGLVFLALITPFITPYSYSEQNLLLGAAPPSSEYMLGTDVLGRDLFTRMLYGSRVSLLVGFLATLVALTIGVLWGSIAGYLGGRTDSLMMRIVDILDGLPFVIFLILILVIIGRSMTLLFLAIGAFGWLSMARIVRVQVLGLRRQDYVLAAQSMGASNLRILFKHIIPNVLSSVIVYSTLLIPQFMLLEAFLSFLGLGVQPPESSWGILIREGAITMEEYWWLLIFPSIVFSLTLFALNFLGDGLRDYLDPRKTQQLS